jgi:hypothetical protein
MKSLFQIWLQVALALLPNLGCLFNAPGHTASACFLVSPTAEVPTIAYGDQNQASIGYDGMRRLSFGYDGGAVPTENKYGHQLSGYRAPLGIFSSFLAAEGAPNLMYHYTTAGESSFANGLWEGSSVTDKLYTDAAQASQELGIPLPNKVIPIQNTGQFVPNSPSIVQPSFRFTGGGSDFINPQAVPPSQLFPAQPISPR